MPLRVFFDVGEIRSMDDWEVRILLGLRQSKMMVAVLSPAYFRSDYCRKEWEIYVETELAHALPGEGIAPIYVVPHPDFEAEPVEDRLRHWVRDLKRRQYIDWLDFWPEGAAAPGAGGRPPAARRAARPDRRAAPAGRGPRAVAAHGPDAEPALRRPPRRDAPAPRWGCSTATSARSRRSTASRASARACWPSPTPGATAIEYPGGRFLIHAANLSDLAAGVIALAEPMGVPLTDAERERPDLALAQVKKAFEDGPPALIVVDNLDDPALLVAAVARAGSAPGAIMSTSSSRPGSRPGTCPASTACPSTPSTRPTPLALLHGFRPIADSPQDDEWKAALEIVHRLGGHALAVEVAGVYLREHPEVSYRQFADDARSATGIVADGGGGRPRGPGPAGLARRVVHRPPARADPGRPHARGVAGRRIRRPAARPTPSRYPGSASYSWPTSPTWPATGSSTRSRPSFQPPGTAPPGRAPVLRPKPDPAHDRRSRRVTARPHAPARPGRGPPASGPDEEPGRREIVAEHASRRAKWINAHWGQPGLAWELPPLRDMIA